MIDSIVAMIGTLGPARRNFKVNCRRLSKSALGSAEQFSALVGKLMLGDLAVAVPTTLG